MARIPETEIERLKSEISLERLVESQGIELKRAGADLLGLCPFHNDREPSLVISPKKNLWHCLGACQTGGTVIDWVMKMNGVSFRHAVELLREGVPVSPLAAAKPVKQSTVPKLAAPVALDADDQVLLNQVIGYYHETLKQSPEALAYLQSRGLDHPELIDRFKLGYANRTLGLRLPEKNRIAGADIRTRLQKIGLYRDSGHEHFNGSLVVPVLDEAGNVLEVYGRKITPNLRPGTPLHLYLPGPHRGVWNVEALHASREIILCEALIDAMTFWCAGYRNVTSAYGIEGFTDEMLCAFQHHGIERVLIAFDRDEAGERGATKVAERLMAIGIECFRIQFPKGMDANDYALKVIPAAKSLGVAIRKAVWLGKGKTPTLPGSAPVTTTPAAQDETPPPPARLPEPVQDSPERAPDSVTLPPSSLAAGVSTEPLPASPVPQAARELPVEVRDQEITLILGEDPTVRRYRVRGLTKNLAVEVLKVNLLVAIGEAFHVDTLDLYSAKHRQSYIAQAAQETGLDPLILKTDLGRVLLALEQLQDDTIAKTLQPEPLPQMDETERVAALSLLQSPHLVERILADLSICGLVGEETNKLVGYLGTISRKLDRPLGIVIQSSSAAGKTSLMDAILAFVPTEERVKYSAMTGQSLFYLGEHNLQHKVLAIVEEEGAARAVYALKLLQSEGELTIASTGKDPHSGNLITQQYRVEGPVALIFTTTARDLDEELMNRCLVLSVDEGRDQTRAIHQVQRERRTLDGLLAKHERQALATLHQNAQRLLRPLEVMNPYAHLLTFPDQTTRLRRDHEKYLTLIDTIAFLHQYQREIKTGAIKTRALPGAQRDPETFDYIEVSLADIALANRIAHDVLGRSLDELPPQTRRLLKLIDDYVVTEATRLKVKRSDVRFSRRALREAINWGDTQLRHHLARLTELEYVLAHREGPGGKFLYELAYVVNDDAHAQVAGLIDAEALAAMIETATPTTPKSRGVTPEVAGGVRGECAPSAAHSRGSESPIKPVATRVSGQASEIALETHSSRSPGQIPSYPQPLAAALS